MTLSSRHRIRNSSPGGLRPSTLPLGHGGSPQYWLSHVDGEETFLFSLKPPRPGTEPRTQGSNFESCVCRTVSSQSSHHSQEVLLAEFSLYVHKGGLKPDSFFLHYALCIVIACLVPKLSYFMFFKMRMGGHLGFRGQDVSKSKKKSISFHWFCHAKKVEFSILYLHGYAYVLLSSKVIIFYVFQKRDGRPSWIYRSACFKI